MKKALQFTAAAVSYAMFWIVTRWPAIGANVLMLDDFELPFRPRDFFTGAYRPTLHLEYILFELIMPHHFWTIVPKFVGAVYVGIAAALLIELLRAWDVDPIIAALLPLIVIANPILADGPLWQTYYNMPVAYGLIIAGSIAWSRDRRLAFFLLTLAGVLGYQIFITLAVVLAVAEAVIRRRFQLREFALRIGLIGVTAVIQLIVVFIIRHSGKYADSRGLISTFSLRDQLHGAADLLVNGWMPVIAYYTGAIPAMSLWKYVPVLLVVLTAVITRRLWPTLSSAGVLLIPALPNLVLAKAPYSWRVSTPVAFALALAMLPILMTVGRRAAAIVIVALTIVMIPVCHYESWCRKESWERDQAFVEGVRQHWRGRDFTLVLAPVNPDKHEDVALIGPHDLTWGYQRRTPRMWSEFNDPWMAKRYVQNYVRMRFLDCNERPAAPACMNAAALCMRPHSDVPVEYPRAFHDDAGNITLVCPR